MPLEVFCGQQDDGLAHSPVDYLTLLPPARGQSYVDPVFGCSVTRLSDGPAEFGTAVHHEYASMSPFNSDNTRILLLTGTGAFFVVDQQGNVVVAPTQGVSGLSEPRWSTTDPHVFYFHEGNELKKYDLRSGQKTWVHIFAEYGAINFGGGESDISDDGDHMVIIGDNRFVQVYQFSTDTAGTALDLQGVGFDWFDMTPNNNVLANYGSNGTGRSQGMELYDRNLNFIRQVVPFVGHAGRGRDINGDEILVMTNNNDLTPLAGCTPGIVKVRLADSQETCLVSFQNAAPNGGGWWNTSPHISFNNSGGHPWALISITDTSQPGTAQPVGELPGDWQARWGVYYNEVFLVSLEGSKKVRRLAHHRSRRFDGYWHTPRAALSRDGTWAIFDTNFGQYPMANYTDVYLLKLWGPPCGRQDDRLVHVPPDYTNLLPPAPRQSYLDPTFGCPVTRLSDGPAEFGTAVHHEYASMSPFNSDNTRILLLTGTGAFFVVDQQGNVVVAPTQGVSGLSEPRWSTTDPHVFYFHEGNQLKAYDVDSRWQTVIRTFSEFATISFGGGESDISDDGDHIVIVGDNRLVQVYQFSTDSLGTALDLQGVGFDWFDMTPNNNVLANYGSNGTGRSQGMELYDRNLNFIRQVIPFAGHADRGRDLNGDEILVMTNNNDLTPLAGCTPGIVKVRLADSQETCLVSFQNAAPNGGGWWNTSPHISVNNSGGHPWALISITDTSQPGTAQPVGELLGDWQARWGVYYNEVFLVSLDGSKVHRLAHHRSRWFGWYWQTPRAALSRDGTLAVFDSTHAHGQPDIHEYTDTYLIPIRMQP